MEAMERGRREDGVSVKATGLGLGLWLGARGSSGRGLLWPGC